MRNGLDLQLDAKKERFTGDFERKRQFFKEIRRKVNKFFKLDETLTRLKLAALFSLLFLGESFPHH
jgi:hypothetical protein